MNRITLEQISELSDKEQRQLKACINEFLGQQMAKRQITKEIMSAKTQIELGTLEGDIE